MVDSDSGEELPPDVEVTSGVPVMDGACQLQDGRSDKNVIYQIDASEEEVVAFYQEELPEFEWELAGPPDNAIGPIDKIRRENAAETAWRSICKPMSWADL